MDNYDGYFKALREAKRLTLREVEKATDVSNAYLSQLESGKIKQPSPISLHKLAQFYGVPYETLMEKVGYPVPTAAESVHAQSQPALSARLGRISQDEEVELLEYLKFMRNRKK